MPVIALCGDCGFQPINNEGATIEGAVRLVERGEQIFFISSEDPRFFSGPFAADEPTEALVSQATLCGSSLVKGQEVTLSPRWFKRDKPAQQIGKNCLRGLTPIVGVSREAAWQTLNNK